MSDNKAKLWLWESNAIQFPRLIAEIAATQNIDFPALCESMNLERLEVYELFDRAENEWKKTKRTIRHDAI